MHPFDAVLRTTTGRCRLVVLSLERRLSGDCGHTARGPDGLDWAAQDVDHRPIDLIFGAGRLDRRLSVVL